MNLAAIDPHAPWNHLLQIGPEQIKINERSPGQGRVAQTAGRLMDASQIGKRAWGYAGVLQDAGLFYCSF
jgi:hypothetical protein